MQILRLIRLTLLFAYLAATSFHARHEPGDDSPPLKEIHTSEEPEVVQADADVVPFNWYMPLSEPIVPEPSIAHLVAPVTQSWF